MTDKKRRTADDYAAASAAWDDGPPTTLRSIEIGPALRMGRPAKDAPSAGKTPGMTVRLPDPIRIEVRHRVKDRHEAASESELVRLALVEYFERHPSR
jgi:hypothetical protein